jgi:hypothetical protein
MLPSTSSTGRERAGAGDSLAAVVAAYVAVAQVAGALADALEAAGK